MFERVGDRLSGHANAALHARAARNLPRLMRNLVNDALDRWAANGWARYDDSEVNCSGQLYRWLVEARRHNISFGLLSVTVENVVFTPGMLQGTEAVTHAARPDLRISVQGRGVFVEAKRLATSGDWCRKYVIEGMARFVNGTYAADEPLGMMVGYVQQPTHNGLTTKVNGHVLAHALMGKGHELGDEDTHAHATRLKSAHTRDGRPNLQLEHLWVVLP